MIEFAGPLKAVSLTFQLAAGGDPLPCDISVHASRVPIYFTVASIPRPIAAHPDAHGHPPHVTRSRPMASTSSHVIELRKLGGVGHERHALRHGGAGDRGRAVRQRPDRGEHQVRRAAGPGVGAADSA